MSVNKLLMIFVFLQAVFNVFCESDNQPKSADPYLCRFAQTQPKIDGVLDDKAWLSADKLEFFKPVVFQKTQSLTEGYLSWDSANLYLGVKAFDDDLTATMTMHDSATYKDDCLELFLMTDETKKTYYNFEMNLLGTVFDAYHSSRKEYFDNKNSAKWNLDDIKIAIKYKGTINKADDKDEYWILEAAIPFRSLPSLNGVAPEVGSSWKFHVARYDYSAYIPGRVELSSTSHLSKVNFHKLEDFSPIMFVK